MNAYEPGTKTHKDENFPVASYIIRKKHRPAILAFYRFAREADDVADHPGLTEDEKITRLDQFEATLLGKANTVQAAICLREVIGPLHVTSGHALDLLIAFRQDARKTRYQDWNELLQYCAYSAAPVGRFVLDVHGENPALWQASDALCAVLQIINHLQDCKDDYKQLNRIYIPMESFAQYHISETDLSSPHASMALREALKALAHKTQTLLAPMPLSAQIRDFGLSLEVTIIEKLARKLLTLLQTRDPLSDNVHLSKMQILPVAVNAVCTTIASRAFRARTYPIAAEKS